MYNKLKAGFIGCGGIANGKHLPALKNIPEIDAVAFCDLIIERAEASAKQYGTRDAKVYTNYEEMIDKEGLDVVYVCTPNNAHAPATVYALTHGANVMCEKPMAKTYAEAKTMLEACKKSGKKLTIGYQNRFSRENLYLHEACEQGELGDIYYGKAIAIRRRGVPTWGVFIDEEKQGGGPLIDIGTHSLDLALWHMNNYKPKSVKGAKFAQLRNQTNTGNAFGDWDCDKYTAEDSAFGFVEMENGALISIESSWAINIADSREAQCVLAGTKAGADFYDGLRINTVKHGRLVIEKPDCASGGVAFYEGASQSAPDVEARMWINAILNDTAPIVLPEQAIVVTRILEAVYESAKTGKEVVFND